MKIYFDLVILLNFFFDFLILFSVRVILKKHTSLKRLLLGSFVGSLTIFCLFIPFTTITLFLFKIFLSVIIILVTFGRRGFLQSIFYFYLVSIILGGGLYLFNITYSYDNNGLMFYKSGLSINFLLIIIVSPIIVYLFFIENKKYKNTYSNVYEVKIYINSKLYKLKGMLDTGNKLCDPYKKRSVIIFDKSVSIDMDDLKFIYVPYKALNTEGVIKCFKPDCVIIDEHVFNNSLIGISKDDINLGDVDCILPNKFKEDL